MQPSVSHFTSMWNKSLEGFVFSFNQSPFITGLTMVSFSEAAPEATFMAF